MDRYQLVDLIGEGVTLHLHGRSGGVWSSRNLEVASEADVIAAERDLAFWRRSWDAVSVVVVRRGVRIAEYRL